MKTSIKMTSIRLDTKLADDAVKVLGALNTIKTFILRSGKFN